LTKGLLQEQQCEKMRGREKFLVVFLCCLVCGCGPIRVLVSNRSESDVRNVNITIPKYSYWIGDVHVNATGETYLSNIAVESSIFVSFSDKEGKKINHDCDVYIDRGFTGEIDITIGTKDVVRCEDNTRIIF
jgi:hypothetical protein